MSVTYFEEPDPYAGLSEEQLKRRLEASERARNRSGNVLALIFLGVWIYVFREELIDALTKLGDLGHG
jgi:hypothetical protein